MKHTDNIACSRCGSSAILVWGSASCTETPLQRELVSIDGDFYERLAKEAPYTIELVCKVCGTVHAATDARTGLQKDELVASLDEATIFEDLMELVRAHQGAAKATAQIIEPSYQSLKLIGQRGLAQSFVRHFDRVDRYGGSVCSQAMLRRAPVIVRDVLADASTCVHRAIFAIEEVRTVISVPVMTELGTFYGMVSVLKNECEEPSQKAIAAMQAHATIAANRLAHLRATQLRPLGWGCTSKRSAR